MADPSPTLAFLQSQYQSAGQLINDVAVEIGLSSVSAPLSSSDPNFIQFKVIANLLGRDLVKKWEWQLFTRTYSFNTNALGPPLPSGISTYPLPLDFFKMINQTAWNRTSRLPMAGPLSAQAWEWLVGLVSNQFTIYLGFRLWGSVFAIYPSPNPANQNIAFEYMSKNWVQPVTTDTEDARSYLISDPGDIILYDPVMFGRGLKMRFLAAKGFDSTDAASDFDTAWEQVTGPDAAASKLNLSDQGFGMRYLDSLNNTPPSGYGMG